MELDELKELKALRDENARLKRIVADQVLNIQVLEEVDSKNGKLVAESPRRPGRGSDGHLFAASGVPLPWAGALKLGRCIASAEAEYRADRGGHSRAGSAPSSVWLSPRA